MVEADIGEKVINAVRGRGHVVDVVNPWNWHHGAFEGIHIDPDTGTRSACGDPRRCSKAALAVLDLGHREEVQTI